MAKTPYTKEEKAKIIEFIDKQRSVMKLQEAIELARKKFPAFGHAAYGTSKVNYHNWKSKEQLEKSGEGKKEITKKDKNVVDHIAMAINDYEQKREGESTSSSGTFTQDDKRAITNRLLGLMERMVDVLEK